MEVRHYSEFRIRLPPDLKEYIQQQAIANLRTYNSEIVYRLAGSRAQDAAAGNASQAQPAA